MRTFEKFHSKAITTIGSTFGSSIALHFALWIIHIFNSFNSKFQFFSVLFATLLHSWAHQIKLWDRDRKMEKNKQIFEFQFRLQFFRSKICILHTRCVILFVIIANSQLVSNYDLLCKNRVSNWKRSHFESERFNWIEQTWFVSLFYVNRNFAILFFSPLNASTFFLYIKWPISHSLVVLMHPEKQILEIPNW